MEGPLLKRLSVGAQMKTPEITVARTEAEVEDWLAANIYEKAPDIQPDIESLEDYWQSLTRPLKVPLNWVEELKPPRPRRTWDKFVEAVEFIVDNNIITTASSSGGANAKTVIHFSKRVPSTMGGEDFNIALSHRREGGRHSGTQDSIDVSDFSHGGDSSISLTSLDTSSHASNNQQSRPHSRERSGISPRSRRDDHSGRGEKQSDIYHHERFHTSPQLRPPLDSKDEHHRDPGGGEEGRVPSSSRDHSSSSSPGSRPPPSSPDNRARNYLPMVESERQKINDGEPPPQSDSSDEGRGGGAGHSVTQTRPKGDYLARKRMQETSNRLNYAMFVGFDAEWPSRQPRYNHLYLSEKHAPPALLQIALREKILLVALIEALKLARPRRQRNWLAQKSQICLWDILEARDRDNTYRILDWRRMPLLRDMLTNKQICKVGEALDNDRCGLRNSAGIEMRGVFDFRVDYDKRVQTLASEFYTFSMNKVAPDIQRLRKGDWLRPSATMLDYAAVDALTPLLVHQKLFASDTSANAQPPISSDAPSAVQEIRRRNAEKLAAAKKVLEEAADKRRARKARLGVNRNHDTSVMIQGAANATPWKGGDIYLWSKGLAASGDETSAGDAEEDGKEEDAWDIRQSQTRKYCNGDRWNQRREDPRDDVWRIRTPSPDSQRSKVDDPWGTSTLPPDDLRPHPDSSNAAAGGKRGTNKWGSPSKENSDSSSPVIQKRVRE